MSNVLAGSENEKVAAYGWAARDDSGILSPFHFTRRENGDDDITLEILYCGICHTDLHFVRNDLGMSIYPMVPGHEIVGKVTKVGSKVTKFSVGDIAGVGGSVGSCGSCSECGEGFYVYCPKMILTYSARYHDGTVTQGGYSDNLVVDQNFAVLIPKSMPLASTAPLLCAGITVYSPLKYHGLTKPGLHLGVVGLGGLGHVAVKFAKAFGLRVTVISTSPSKKKEALETFGADAFLVSRDQQQLQDAVGTMDAIFDTVSANHSIQPLIGLLKTRGKLILLGGPANPLEVLAMPLLLGRKMIAGSAGGGREEIQEMINFAAKHNITADVEVISMEYVNTALERLEKNDVKYRFVIDVANTI
ncbi:probable mannitol dehydrogenase [Vigna unguiculata]|uniref:Cinnamyl-alcohol dehydrogenase n=1 Tax=Vigna unguiculata TaxID=3917 RepID=A0A4D6LRM5_VIGUN|nr:probable mannitol dehydrogenase [Vigna unguiculata]QCD90736.1 cinnamyl-alcohol dehydrogenase [Vigna unguiculata]